MEVMCSSPTCAATIELPDDTTLAQRDWWLARSNWSVEVQPGDDRPWPYCPRCKL